MIVADDGNDYEALLAAEGLRDPRLRFLSSGAIGGGASRARNVALDAITAPYAAILDADDRFKPEKLKRAVAALAAPPIVSAALDEFDENERPLRLVGAGPDRELGPATYKWTCLSMDSMIVWDRRRTDARYDHDPHQHDRPRAAAAALPHCAASSCHLGTPLHDYLKLSVSMSNGPGVTEKMIRSKRELLRRLETGFYPMADASGPEGMAISCASRSTPKRLIRLQLAARPGLLFEDHIEPMLRAAAQPLAERRVDLGGVGIAGCAPGLRQARLPATAARRIAASRSRPASRPAAR